MSRGGSSNGDLSRGSSYSDLSGGSWCIIRLEVELVPCKLILSIKLTPEDPEPLFRFQADGIRVVDVSSLRGRPFTRTLRGGNTAGGGRGSRLAGSGTIVMCVWIKLF